jgi:PBP1b-binding outer membrane lipoprotein LpoB
MKRIKVASTSLTLALIAGLALFLSACSGNAPAGSAEVAPEAKPLRGTVWVADEYGNSITVIDAATTDVVQCQVPEP